MRFIYVLTLSLLLTQIGRASPTQSEIFPVIEEGLKKYGFIPPKNLAAIGAVIKHPTDMTFDESTCAVKKSGRTLFKMKPLTLPCTECNSEMSKSYIAFYAVVPDEIKKLNLSCQADGFENLQLGMNRQYLFPGWNWVSGFLGQTQWTTRHHIQNVRSSSDRITFNVKIPSFPLQKVKTAIGQRDRFDINGYREFTKTFGDSYKSQAEIPVVSRLIAIPQGASIKSIVIQGSGRKIVKGIKLYPVQQGTIDHPGFKPSFKYDDNTFRKRPIIINKPLLTEKVHHAYLNLYKLVIPAVGYNPISENLDLYQSLKIDIAFDKPFSCYYSTPYTSMDGIDRMIENRSDPLLAQVLNQDARKKYCRFRTVPIKDIPLLDRVTLQKESSNLKVSATTDLVKPAISIGDMKAAIILPPPSSRLLIIYPEIMQEAAETLAKHKVSMGISTQLLSTKQIEVSNQGFDADAIKRSLTSLYQRANIKPRWVIFLGDVQHIPTYYFKVWQNRQVSNLYDRSYNAGDTWFGQLTGDLDSIPELMIGRLPVDDELQAMTIVNKIINYELDPIQAARFYESNSISASFIDNNSDGISDNPNYAEFVERNLETFISNSGQSMDRIYKATDKSDPYRWSDSTQIKDELLTPSFNWQSGVEDFLSTMNQGHQIQIHRGHGWINKIFMPDIHQDDLGGLSFSSSSQSPFFVGISCATGFFDNESVVTPDNRPHPENGRRLQFITVDDGPLYDKEYFGEKLVNHPNGAIAFLGDTRSSLTEMNNELARGLFETLYQRKDHSLSLGEIMNSAKAHMYARYVDQNRFVLMEHQLIYNLLGDPTIRLWGESPLIANLVSASESWRTENDVQKRYANASISLLDPNCNSCLQSAELHLEQLKLSRPIGVLVDDDGRTYGRGVFNEQGNIQIEIAASLNIRDLYMVVSGNHLVPKRFRIPLRFLELH